MLGLGVEDPRCPSSPPPLIPRLEPTSANLRFPSMAIHTSHQSVMHPVARFACKGVLAPVVGSACPAGTRFRAVISGAGSHQ